MKRYAMQNYFDYIDDDELRTFFSGAVKIPSINPPGNEAPMVQYIENFLQANKIEYERIPVEGNRCDIVARVRGKTRENSIIFTGHMDVVPVSDEERGRWNFDPFGAEIRDGVLYGRGSSDMKSGLTAALYAMAVLQRHGIVPPTDIIFAATIDEENYMKGSKKLLYSPFFDGARSLVVCEPTDLKLCIKGKGRTWADVCVRGKTAHGSQAGAGDNAIYTAINLIEKIKHTELTGYSSAENGVSFWRTLAIQAGVEPQVVPDTCVFTVDARLAVGHPIDAVWAQLDELIAALHREVPTAQVSYIVVDRRPSWTTAESDPLVQRCKTALEAVGLPYIPNIFAGSTDGSVLVKQGLTPVIIGPGDLAVVHRENEHIKLSQLYQAARLYLSMMLSRLNT